MKDLTDVLLVTTWGAACGISEHSAYLVDAVRACGLVKGLIQGDQVNIQPSAEALDPAWVFGAYRQDHPMPPILHLNYHRALHSRWTPDQVERAKDLGSKIVITFHDTREEADDLLRAFARLADRLIVHEPVDWPGPLLDLSNVSYWRQGVPDYPATTKLPRTDAWKFRQPIVGTVGFPFPWKNYDLLCHAAAEAGWGVLLLAPNATPEQIRTWWTINPASHVIPTFTPREKVVEYLAGCDATAFLYTCANTGTSGAIRQGLAARKPVIAQRGCRQFRDLQLDPAAAQAITWTGGTVDHVAALLSLCPLRRVDPEVIRVAARDSWAGMGQRYTHLYHQLLAS